MPRNLGLELNWLRHAPLDLLEIAVLRWESVGRRVGRYSRNARRLTEPYVVKTRTELLPNEQSRESEKGRPAEEMGVQQQKKPTDVRSQVWRGTNSPHSTDVAYRKATAMGS